MTDVEIGLSVQSDSSGVQRARRDLQNIRQAQDDLRDSFRDGTVDAGRFTSELEDLEKQARTLDRALDALEEPRQVNVRNDDFDRISRDVGLAGDVQSNLGALSGLSGAAGADGLGQGIGIAGELVVLTEELPRLKTAVQGLPQTAKAAASALGPTGIGLGVAVVAIGAAAAIAARRIERAQAQLKGTTDAFAEFERFRLDATTDEARERLEDLQKDLQATNTTLETLRGAGEAAAETNPLLGELITRFGGYAQTIRELEDQQAVLNNEIGFYAGAIQDNVFAVNDAAAAQREYTDRIQEFVDNAARSRLDANRFLADPDTGSDDVDRRIQDASRDLALIGDELRSNEPLSATYREELIRQQQDLTVLINTLREGRSAADSRTAQANAEQALEDIAQQRITGIQQQIALEQELANAVQNATVANTESRLTALTQEGEGLQRLIAELEPMAAGSEAAAAELANARTRLNEVKQEIGLTFNDVLPAAVGRAVQSLQDDIGNITSERDSNINKIRADLRQREADFARARNDAIIDAERDAQTARLEAARTAKNSLAEVEQDLERERAKIQRRAARSEQQAIGERDALAAVRARQNRKDQLNELEREGEERRAEIAQQLEQQREQIAAALNQQRELAQERYQSELEAARVNANEQIQAEREKARQEIDIRRRQVQNELLVLQQGAEQATQIVARQVQAINQALAQINVNTSRGNLDRQIDRRIAKTLR